MSKFRMIGKDVNCWPEQYRVWSVNDSPDYNAQQYKGIKSGDKPLENVTAYLILEKDNFLDFNLPNISDPNVKTWIDTKKSLPEPIQDGQLAIIKHDIFIFGGKNSNKIYKSTINNPTKWEICQSTLPSKLSGSQLAVIKDRIYLFGGESDKCLDTIYSASIDDPLNWTNHGSMLPKAIRKSQLAIVGENIYLFGGLGESSPISSIFKSTLTQPLIWQDTNKHLPIPIYNSCILLSSDNIYLFGGTFQNELSSEILHCKTSDPENWSFFGSLPVASSNIQSIILGDKIYLIVSNKKISESRSVARRRVTSLAFYENDNLSSKNDKAEIYESNLQDPSKWMRIKNKIPQNTLYSHLAFIYDRFFIFGGSGTKSIIASTYKAKFNLNDEDVKNYKNKITINYKNTLEDNFKILGFAPWRTDLFNR